MTLKVLMPRVVVLILVAVQVFMTPGVCLRKCGVTGWLTSPQPSNCHIEPAGRSHRVTCCSGCRERAAQVREVAGSSGSPVRACEERRPLPAAPHPDSDCWASCKAKSDKLVQHESPQVNGEVVSLGFMSAVPVQARPRRPDGPTAVVSAPPLYVIHCTLLF